jgi:hypothetical protein
MGGGLLQLVAYGAQDVYLTGNPQITFFKVVYRRHTNFAIEAIQQTPSGRNTFGSRVTYQITRNGDLIHRLYFSGKITNNNTNTDPEEVNGTWNKENVALVPNVGQKLLKSVELEIGGQRIDKHYSEWLYIWNELSLPVGKRYGYNTMVGANDHNLCTKLAAGASQQLYVPLEFWFCRNVGLALPLIALQYHEVKVNIEYEEVAKLVDISEHNMCIDEFERSSGCTNGNKQQKDTTADYEEGTFSSIENPTGGAASATTLFANEAGSINLSLDDGTLWADYIFLDTDERRRFAQLSHEYLIEQLQFTGADTIDSTTNADSMKNVRLTFNHPCKELLWTVKSNDADVFWNNFSNAYTAAADKGLANIYESSKNPVHQAKLLLNGNDRFATRRGDYFSIVQPYQHHENTPNKTHQGINVYSFALKPEEHQPSGTLNMSRIDTAILSLSAQLTGNKKGTLNVYAVNYNVLRILSGMGGLAYSN